MNSMPREWENILSLFRVVCGFSSGSAVYVVPRITVPLIFGFDVPYVTYIKALKIRTKLVIKELNRS